MKILVRKRQILKSSHLHFSLDSASFSDHFYSNPSSLNYMDWMTIPSPPIIIDNNPDFTQFDIDHHFLFDSTYQQQNTLSFDLSSPSSSII